MVVKKYSRKQGFPHDSEILYGDTDSIMIKFGVKSKEEAMSLAIECAEYVTRHFKKPIALVFERVYQPYLLMSKKKYAGKQWIIGGQKVAKIDSRGVETVRRDYCRLVGHVLSTVLDILLNQCDKNKALKFVHGMLNDLLQNRIDISMLVITKMLSKKHVPDDEPAEQAEKTEHQEALEAAQPRSKYAHGSNNIPHVQVVERMKKRELINAPMAGERIPYVIIKGIQGQVTGDLSEDPVWVLERDLPINFQHYIDK